MQDRVGQQLGNYRLLRLLGRGGFAEVYLGEHAYLKSHAALKVLHTQLTAEDAHQFIAEAQLLAGLSHPHIVRILDFAIQEGLPFLVMEYAPSGTLRTRHPKHTPLPLDTVVPYVTQVAAALQYAHDQHVIHRDIKPENMLLSSRDDVLLSDFGLAMLMPSPLSASTEPLVRQLAGTFPYLAPEQLQGRPRLASDQYALAVVVYEWLCGTPPFRGSSIEIATQHLSVPPPPLRTLLPNLSPAVEEVLLRALAKEPEHRFARVQDFAISLEHASQEVAVHRSMPVSAVVTRADQNRPPVPPLHIALLGEFHLVSGETPVTSIDMRRLQSLLAYLVLHRTAPQPRSHLAYLLWPESTDAQSLTNLRASFHRLRSALPNVDTFLRADRHVLAWQNDAPWTLDVLDFEQALAQADQAAQSKDQRGIRQALVKAVDLYRGDLLPNCYDEWILPERDRLRQAFLGALERLIGLLEEEGDYDAAIRAAQHLLRHDPLHEATYRRLMRLYALTGNRAAALRTYHICATVLERELAVKPGRATREAYARLMQTEQPADEATPRTTLVAAAPLLGRKREWVQLQEAWRSAAAGRAHMLVLSGEPGIGKTRLAEELLVRVGRQGIATAIARCYASEGELAYAPLVTWLRTDPLRKGLATLSAIWLSEVARLVPALLTERPDLPRPTPLVEGWQRQQLFEALARAILADNRPVVLLLDDIQWCDRETLTFLHYLLRFDPHAPLLLLAAVRAEEMVSEHAFSSLLVSLRQEGLVTEVALEPLDAAGTASLARHVAGYDLSPTMATDLYRETEGNPLFVVETARMGALEHERSQHHLVGEKPPAPVWAVPATIQTVIMARLAQLSPPARELVNVAAVIGRAFTFAVLAQAAGSDEDALVRGLDELWQRRIVREQGSDSYDFSHDKLREGAYVTLSTARRRMLHRRVAQALEVVHAESLDSVSGQIAVHYEHASLAQQAIPYYQRAGEVASQVYANADALASFRRALQLVEAIPPGPSRQEWQQKVAASLHERVGDVLDLIGQYDEAIAAYQRALAYVPGDDELGHARLHLKTGNIWPMLDNYKEAQDAYDRAESTLGREPTASEVAQEWWHTWIDIQLGQMWVHHWPSGVGESSALVAKTRQVVERHGTPAQQATFFQSCYLMNLGDNRDVTVQEVLSSARARLAADQQSGSTSEVAWARFDLGVAHLWCGSLAEGEEQMHAALTVGERTGDATLQARCLIFLAVLYRKRGQVEAVRHASSRVLAMQKAEYQAIATANLAWVAWREGKFLEAQEKGRAALNQWPALLIVSPFQWTARWPLVAVALAQDQVAEAVDLARKLLIPQQERLPQTVMVVVEAAVQAWDSGQPDITCAYLQQALALAQEMGYL